MSTKFDVFRACQPLITEALALNLAERRLPAGTAATEITSRTTALIQQAYALTELVDALEPGEKPKSWRRPENERQAS